MSLFGKKNKPKEEAQTSVEQTEVKNAGNVIPEDTMVAISMSLALYFNDRHDAESDVVTIQQRNHNYSPWNSKIYGINNILK